MKINKLPALALGLGGLVTSIFLSTGLAYADTRPYFQVRGGDVFAGGWFLSKDPATNQYTCDLATNYQAPTYSPALSNQYKGGILAFNNYSSGTARGALVDFGAFALGQIEGDTSLGFGFASNGGNGNNKLSLSNANPNGQGTSYWGGFFDAGTRQVHHCTQDYFNLKQNSPGIWPGSVDDANSGQYLDNSGGSAFELNAGTVAAGKSITLFVNRDVHINGNITYAAHNADTVPKFALVVKGSIFIDKNVTQLDGLYIAQPDLDPAKPNPVTTNTGVIWTCSTATAQGPTDTYVSKECRDTNLTVNGALIAKQVNLLRLGGDVGGPVVAETINYTPEMVIGGPAFYTTANADPKIESLISLPPVY